MKWAGEMMEPIKHNARLWERRGGGGSDFLFWCPACKHAHRISTPRWGFDGNVATPTFTPSLRLSWQSPVSGQTETVCHLNVASGKLLYHGDCPHELKGQTIPMQDLPPEYGF